MWIKLMEQVTTVVTASLRELSILYCTAYQKWCMSHPILSGYPLIKAQNAGWHITKSGMIIAVNFKSDSTRSPANGKMDNKNVRKSLFFHSDWFTKKSRIYFMPEKALHVVIDNLPANAWRPLYHVRDYFSHVLCKICNADTPHTLAWHSNTLNVNSLQLAIYQQLFFRALPLIHLHTALWFGSCE